MKINTNLYVSLLLAFFSAIAVSGEDSQVQSNSIYQSCGKYMYEQGDIVESEAFKAADQEQQIKMLQNEFYRRKRKCYLWEGGRIVATLALPLYGAYLAYQNFDRDFLTKAISAYGMAYIGFGNIVSRATGYVQSQSEILLAHAIRFTQPNQNDVLEKYENDYVAKKRFLSKQLQEVLEQNFIEARLSKSAMGDGMGTSRKSKAPPIDFARDVLSLPTEKLEIVYDKNEFEKYLGTFEREVIDPLKLVAAEHAAASTGETVKRTALMLVGPPGVGKTKAAKALADALHSPFRSIKIGGKTLAEIEGDESNPGLLLEALKGARNREGKNGKNPVIFFDELDRALGMSERGYSSGQNRKGKMSYGDVSSAIIPFLLDLFESETKTFYSPYLRTDVDISDILFICAGNVDWDVMLKDAETKDKALKDRFEFVRFNGYTPEFKFNVTKAELFDEILVTYKRSKTPLSADDFMSEDWKAIEKMVLGDKEPGFREVVRKLKKFIARKALCKYTGECQIGVFDEDVLSLPTEKLEIVYDKNKFDKYLGTFEKEVVDPLKLVGAEHAAASASETVIRSALMLVGPPGVGKTKAAKAVADALDSPFKSIKIGGKTLAEIEGDESNPGLLLEALMSAKSRQGKKERNTVIFFDELDRAFGLSEGGYSSGSGRKGKMSYGDVSSAITSFLLDLFESGTKTFYSPYLRTNVDISDILFITASNVDWDVMLKYVETKDRALKDHFEFVRFNGYTPEFKLKVTKAELFDEILATYKKSKTSLSADDFTSEDWKAIEKMVLGDKEPGIREVVRKLKKFIARKALCKYTGECQIGVFDE